MFRVVVSLIILINIAFSSSLKIDAVSLVGGENIYEVYDNDILLLNKDKLKFYISSKEELSLDISYIFKNKEEKLKTIKLKSDTKSQFPIEKNSYLNFDKEGDVTFIFKSNDKIIKKFNIKYINNKKTITNHTTNSILNNAKYAINPNTIIGNDRGLKEKQAYNKLIKSTLLIETPNEIGTGILISNDGKVLTNYHVIKDNSFVNVAFKPKSKFQTTPSKNNFLKAKVLKVDELKDLALLQILEKKSLKNKIPITLSALDDIDIGEDIYTMGHPQKEFFTLGWGTVTQVRQNYSWNKHKANYVIQTQSSTSKGSSGGALLDENYKLIGINSFSNTKGQNLNFAISIYDIQEFLSKNISEKFSIKLDNKYKNYTKLSSKSGYDKQNTPLTQYELDSNDNNIKDLVAIDIGNNGIYNYLLFDIDEDGNYDKKAYDKDGDGIIERVVVY